MRYWMISHLRAPFQLCSMSLLLFYMVPLAAQAQEAGATIYGEVKAGRLQPDVEIRVVNTKTKKPVMTGMSKNGHYRMSGIPAGKYHIVARDGEGFLPGEHKGQKLTDGDEKQFHFDLKRPPRYTLVGGIIRDSKRSPIPFVDVVAILSEFEIERTKTNIAGQYEFRIPIAPQAYTFVVEVPGALTGQLEAEVNTVQPTFSDLSALRIDLTMKEESGAASTLLPTVSVVAIAQLPLQGATQRDLIERADVISGPPAIVDYYRWVSVSSGASRSTQINLDGGLIVDNVVGATSQNFSQDIVQEFQVLMKDRSVAGSINQALLTNSGTNNFHGSLSYRAGNDAFNARDPFNSPGFDTFRSHLGSGGLGGPIWKDHIFFFLGYDLNRNAQAPTFSPVLVSRLADLNERLAELGLHVEDLRRFLTTSSSDTPLLRLDFRLSANHSVSADYSFQEYQVRKDFPIGPFGTSGTPSSARDSSRQYQALSLKHSWTITSTFVNEAFYRYRRDKAFITPAEPNQISLLIPGLALIGRATDPIEGDGNRRTSHIFSDSLTLILGRHTLKFAGQGEFDQTLFRFDAFESGRAIVPELEALSSSQRTLNDLGARPVGVESASRVDLFQIGFGGSEVRFNTSAFAPYIQDSFKARSNLTLIFGLRYKADFPPSFQRKDTAGFQPQLGMAWDLTKDGKTLFRAGYSMTRERLPQLPIGFELLMGGKGLQTDHLQPFRRVLSFVGGSATSAFNQFIADSAIPAGPQLATIYNDESRSPITQNVDVGFERYIKWETSINVTYKYSRGGRLLTSTNVNLPPPILRNGRPDFGNAVLIPAFAQIYQFQTDGNSSYHGGTLRVNRRYSHHFMVDARYVFSKLIDDVPSLSYYGAISGLHSVSFEATPENAFDRARERALSESHAAHRFLISAQGNMPEWRDNNFLLRNLGRLSFSGEFNFNSGRYFNVVTGFDANRDGNPLTDRPLGVGRNTFLGQRYARLDSGVKYRSGKERWHFEVSIDVINLPNRANFAAFNTVLGRSDLAGLDPDIVSGRRGISDFNYRKQLAEGGFGLASMAYSPRRILLGLRFIF